MGSASRVMRPGGNGMRRAGSASCLVTDGPGVSFIISHRGGETSRCTSRRTVMRDCAKPDRQELNNRLANTAACLREGDFLPSIAISLRDFEVHCGARIAREAGRSVQKWRHSDVTTRHNSSAFYAGVECLVGNFPREMVENSPPTVRWGNCLSRDSGADTRKTYIVKITRKRALPPPGFPTRTAFMRAILL